MDGLAAGISCRRDQFPNVEIGFRRRRGAEEHGGVGVPDVGCEAIRLGIDRDGLEAFLVTCANDADRDLTAVRNQHALQ